MFKNRKIFKKKKKKVRNTWEKNFFFFFTCTDLLICSVQTTNCHNPAVVGTFLMTIPHNFQILHFLKGSDYYKQHQISFHCCRYNNNYQSDVWNYYYYSHYPGITLLMVTHSSHCWGCHGKPPLREMNAVYHCKERHFLRIGTIRWSSVYILP